MKLRFTCIVLLIFALSLRLPAYAQKTGYEISAKINLPGEGGWDYLSVYEKEGLLFISHGNRVQVVDLKTKALKATVEDTNGVHGIAFAEDLNKCYISDDVILQ
jgi:hypothetical protein